ncbi:flavodoxin family protein [Paratractidigestivibacter sp.]|uniref:flavodoxin family protein n=1 Tax=Paratractidigestivibacter sp. TaxID=2847316 RepID=UPI002ABE3E5E|nr:NAD(P)H-dependent oxidoreductase [Paratractidigestivibacter sp.]
MIIVDPLSFFPICQLPAVMCFCRNGKSVVGHPGNGERVLKDDVAGVLEKLRAADAIVFASPIYWFDITAQEKAAIDRMYAFGGLDFLIRQPLELNGRSSCHVNDRYSKAHQAHRTTSSPPTRRPGPRVLGIAQPRAAQITPANRGRSVSTGRFMPKSQLTGIKNRSAT